MKGKGDSNEDDYNSLSFNREKMRFSDAMKRHNSESHRDFLENKLTNSPTKLRIEEFIGTTLSKLQSKVKGEIVVGASHVSPQVSNLRNLNKKIQIELAENELNNTLSLNRGKIWATITKEDYKRNKQMVSEKMRELQQINDEDTNKIIDEIARIHKTSTGMEGKSLIGKLNLASKDNNENSLELAKQMVKKLQEEKKEYKQKMKEIKEKRKELKAKKIAEDEKRK